MSDVKQIETEVLGALDPTFIVNAAAELFKGGITEYNKGEAAKKSAAEDEARVTAAIDADNAAARALYELDLAKKRKQSEDVIGALQAVATQALSAQQQAAMGLSSLAQSKRVAKANENAAVAAKVLIEKPSDLAAIVLAKVAAENAIRVATGRIVVDPQATAKAQANAEQAAKGGVPPWKIAVGVGVGAVVVGGIVGIVMLFRKRR